ncbi:transmembrane protein 145 [Diachasma alloeum]|uniref:transmembrane protein 145 n=1 Tax=Diachasma alloeum TaxID=454923 RepID=UPI0007381C6C|nr:transmembrane protein 145 [Diachasma alloeum]
MDERANSLHRWQLLWDASTNGSWIHRLIPRLDPWVNRPHGEVNYYLTQMLSGHGFKYEESPECPACPGVSEDAEHVFFTCPHFNVHCSTLETALGGRIQPENLVEAMFSSETAWEVTSAFAAEVLKDLRKAEHILPLLIAVGFFYIILLGLSTYMAIQLRYRRLLHVTYRLYIGSVILQSIGICCEIYCYIHQGLTGFEAHQTSLAGSLYEGGAEIIFTLLLFLLALGYTVTRSSLTIKEVKYISYFVGMLIILQLTLFVYQWEIFDPGLVLYIYESPPGFGLLTLKILAWGIFVICCWRTSRKTTTKFHFYASLLSLGSIWFLCHPLTV